MSPNVVKKLKRFLGVLVGSFVLTPAFLWCLVRCLVEDGYGFSENYLDIYRDMFAWNGATLVGWGVVLVPVMIYGLAVGIGSVIRRWRRRRGSGGA